MSNGLIEFKDVHSAPDIAGRTGRLKILLADDHEILLDMLRNLLEPEFEVIAQATDGDTLLRVAPQLQPDVAVIDMVMPGISGLDAGRELHRKMPALKLIYLSMETDPARAAAAFAGGASAYLSKACSAVELQQAIRIVAGGGCYLTADIADGDVEKLLFAHHASPITKLSTRELEVLQLLVGGLSMKSVGRRLGIAPRTVAFHKYRAMEELGLRSNVELVDFAIRHGLLRSRAFAGALQSDSMTTASGNT